MVDGGEKYQKGERKMQASEKWIPINEQVPEHNQLCLVTVEQLLGFDDIDRLVSIGRYRVHGFEIAANDGMFPEDKFHRVTAWIPVPEAYDGEQ